MWQLLQFPLCPFSRKVRLLLGEKGVGYTLVRENPWERRDEFIDIRMTRKQSADRVVYDGPAQHQHAGEVERLKGLCRRARGEFELS